MSVESIIKQQVGKAIEALYGQAVPEKSIALQATRKDVKGDITVVVFPFLRLSKKSPEQTANDIGEYLKENIEIIADFSVIKGFLNIVIAQSYWVNVLNTAAQDEMYGYKKPNSIDKTIMIEYSSPNTNKPLHLGHIRNNLLGWSVAEILKANGYKVVKVNLVNDRGIHICKSMLAWQKFGNGETPEQSGKKGDKLVGDYYVRFDKEYKKEIEQLVADGMSKEEAEKKAPLLLEAQAMLRKWEAKDPEIYELWKTMNQWVYTGFDVTYNRMGIDFDKIYYESETYLLGKKIVEQGVEKGVYQKKDDNSIWADLTADGLDQKLLLRSDGTSVYMTQDIGTAHQRHEEYDFDKLLYVVGNEQDYHFKVLSLILGKVGFDWSKNLFHLSYGMVDLPSGKMKSREGTVVDADDLMTEMENTARQMSEELGKLDGYSKEEAQEVYSTISMGALKYFILKVDPKKRMMFNPQESIDFNGNTGPFIQYTYARIQSIIRKADASDIDTSNTVALEEELSDKELQLIKQIYEYPTIINEAGENYSPALVGNYIYDLVKEYNQFYHDFSILKEENEALKSFRLLLSKTVAGVIKSGMHLLGIKVPERM